MTTPAHPNVNTRYARTIAPSFVRSFRDMPVPWGPVGYVTYKRTYSR